MGALALTGWLISTVALIALLLALLLARRLVAGRAREVAEACHELRGPLTAAVLGLGLAGRQGTLSPARVRAIELELERAALALDDLESARDGVGRRHGCGAVGRRCRARKAGAGAVSIDELLADSVEAWRPAAALRGVELRLRWFGAPVLVPGDRLRLAQATGNLIANAIIKSCSMNVLTSALASKARQA
jgi:signal transduction histidine kinase